MNKNKNNKNNEPRPEWWLSCGWLAADFNNEIDFYEIKPRPCGEPGEYFSEGHVIPVRREDLPDELRNLQKEDGPVQVEMQIAIKDFKKL